MTDRSARSTRPPVVLFSPGGRPGVMREVAETELRVAFEVRRCGRLDAFREAIAEARVGVVVGKGASQVPVFEVVERASGPDGTPPLVVVDDDRPPIPCEWLAPWQVAGSLLPKLTALLIRDVLDRRQRAVLRDGELRERSPVLQRALIRVLERRERPIVRVQDLARALPGRIPVPVRSLASAWAARNDEEIASELGLKQLLSVVVLLRGLLLRIERPEMSWSDVALTSGVHPRTLSRYLKRYAGVTAGRLELAEIPALVMELERRVVEAVG